jgi:glycosyltransferase involved in cell wall biosynthesis
MANKTTTTERHRVCMVSYVESPKTIPTMFNQGVYLARAGFEVEALCLASSSASLRGEEHAPGFRTRRFAVRTRTFFHSRLGLATSGRRLVAVQRVLSYLEYVANAFVQAVKSGPDLYTAHDLPALLPAVLAAKLRRKPIVYNAHEIWSETLARVPFARFWRLLARLLVPLCDEVVTPEEHRSRIYQDEFGAKRLPLTVRNCAPFRAPIASTTLRDELARRGIACSTIVLYQGLIDSMRCIEEIAEASRSFDDGIVLVIIGSGFGKWAKPSSSLKGHERIVVVPPVRNEDLPPYTASADIGILLYRNDCRNNFYCAPNKLFEYMMMGLPVIAPSYPGMKALVEGEVVGVCVNPEDPRQIAAAVNRLAADQNARQAMRANGLRLSRERYNWENEFTTLFERYRSLLVPRRVELRREGARRGTY